MDARTGLPRVGMVGGGQLARMTHQAAIGLGQSLRVLAVDPDDSAGLVAPDVLIGRHDDLDALRAFAADCDVLTFDHEHVPGDHVRALIAEGHRVYPGPDALRYAQNKSAMRQRLQELGAPIPPFRILSADAGAADAGAGDACAADAVAAVAEFGAEFGFPVVVKTATGGYDGRGVWLVGEDEIASVATHLANVGELVMEQRVPLKRELAAVLARSPFGQAALWPVVQTVQQDGICVQVIAPAPDLPPQKSAAASDLALRIAAALDVVGVLAVELFDVEPSEQYPDGLVVNELAMRPHNSGHWSMDGAVTGQFEQHLRAVLDYPLGATHMVAPHTVMGNVLGGPAEGPGAALSLDERVHHLSARFPQVKIHLYGKAFRPGRKLGHVNVSGSDLAELREIAHLSAAWLGTGEWPDGYSIHQHQPKETR